jgi:hypothetical protein
MRLTCYFLTLVETQQMRGFQDYWQQVCASNRSSMTRLFLTQVIEELLRVEPGYGLDRVCNGGSSDILPPFVENVLNDTLSHSTPFQNYFPAVRPSPPPLQSPTTTYSQVSLTPIRSPTTLQSSLMPLHTSTPTTRAPTTSKPTIAPTTATRTTLKPTPALTTPAPKTRAPTTSKPTITPTTATPTTLKPTPVPTTRVPTTSKPTPVSKTRAPQHRNLHLFQPLLKAPLPPISFHRPGFRFQHIRIAITETYRWIHSSYRYKYNY